MSLPILFFYIVLFCFCFSFRRFCLCLYHWQMGVCFVYSFIFYSMFELSNVFKEFFFCSHFDLNQLIITCIHSHMKLIFGTRRKKQRFKWMSLTWSHTYEPQLCHTQFHCKFPIIVFFLFKPMKTSFKQRSNS